MSAARRKRKPVEAEEKKKRMPTTRYTPDYRKGLTSQQVQEHKLHGWTNQAVFLRRVVSTILRRSVI
mgnify:CR=1 FL=1